MSNAVGHQHPRTIGHQHPWGVIPGASLSDRLLAVWDCQQSLLICLV
jgi:hypothetical protein